MCLYIPMLVELEGDACKHECFAQDFEQFAKIDCPTPEIQERWCTEVLHNILKKRVARVVSM